MRFIAQRNEITYNLLQLRYQRQLKKAMGRLDKLYLLHNNYDNNIINDYLDKVRLHNYLGTPR